jgi:hypothetical protein
VCHRERERERERETHARAHAHTHTHTHTQILEPHECCEDTAVAVVLTKSRVMYKVYIHI